MNKKFTLIYQFNTFRKPSASVFSLQKLLEDDNKLQKELRTLKNFRLESPPIKILEKFQ
jgi:hypothetical protein